MPERKGQPSPKSVRPRKPTARSQLQTALKLANNAECFKRIKADIMAIAERHWDQERPTGEQGAATKATEKELGDTHPDLFQQSENDSDGALQSAILYLKHRHGKNKYARQTWKQKHNSYGTQRISARKQKNLMVDKSVPGQEPSEYIKAPLSTPSQPEGPRGCIAPPMERTPLVERMAANLAHYASHPSNTQIFGTPINRISASQTYDTPAALSIWSKPRTGCVPHIAVPPRRKGLSVSVSTASSSSQAIASSSNTLGAEVTPQPACFTYRPSARQMSNIYDFLHTCVPPMTHFFQRFIDFGCTTQDHLFGISVLPRDKVELFLKQLPAAPDGTPMSPMEMFILCEQFYTYKYVE